MTATVTPPPRAGEQAQANHSQAAWERALARAGEESIEIMQVGPALWVATSSTTGEWAYDIRRWGASASALSCTCPAGGKLLICKHMAKGRAAIELETRKRPP